MWRVRVNPIRRQRTLNKYLVEAHEIVENFHSSQAAFMDIRQRLQHLALFHFLAVREIIKGDFQPEKGAEDQQRLHAERR